MMNEANNKILKDIFRFNLKKDARSVSIATLMSDRYLRRTKYDPYYQRNYVWEKDKQSFFIESIFLGTEIPPIVFYKRGTQVEVIDGRQRFETIKRFKENDFALHSSGLITLRALSGKKYKNLESFQQVFDDTKIRIFEFEIVGMPDLSPAIEDKVKKEIFRRYNSGITPLNSSEVDNAKYTDDNHTDYFKKVLKEDDAVYEKIRECFFQNSKKRKNDLIIDMAAQLRKLMVLYRLPISRYADSGKNLLIEMLYDKFVEESTEDGEDTAPIEQQLLDDVSLIREIVPNGNNYIYECLMWIISIIREKKTDMNLSFLKENANQIAKHYQDHYDKYNTESDHYYGNVVARFEDTANFFHKLYDVDFSCYIRNADFKQKIQEMQQTEDDAELTMERLNGLRISKPNPASKPVDQLLREVEKEKYSIRPPYQRQEKINVLKASSIIESILLGIKLPPIFVYVRNDGIKEVIDGQQRLLTIIGFLGRKYRNEEGKTVSSINDSFKLRGLRILVDYNGKRYSDLIGEVEDAILDFDIDEIEISQEINPYFSPTDLFIRLNNKPYPIKPNTFEMWNSITDRAVIQEIKDVTKKYSSWFYVTLPKLDDKGNSTDRMQNEELITILSYLCFSHKNGEPLTKILGFYPRMKKFTCRLKVKSMLTTVLENLEDKPTERDKFLEAINQTERIINFIRDFILNGEATKESFNSILNVKNLPTFSRTYQELYVLWEILINVNMSRNSIKREDLVKDICHMLSLLKNVNDVEVENEYVDNFIKELELVQNKYK